MAPKAPGPENSHRSQRAPAVFQPSLVGLFFLFVVQKFFIQSSVTCRSNCPLCIFEFARRRGWVQGLPTLPPSWTSTRLYLYQALSYLSRFELYKRERFILLVPFWKNGTNYSLIFITLKREGWKKDRGLEKRKSVGLDKWFLNAVVTSPRIYASLCQAPWNSILWNIK